MIRQHPLVLAAAAVLAATGCGGLDLQSQALTPIEFTLAGHYAETKGIDSPFADRGLTFVDVHSRDETLATDLRLKVMQDGSSADLGPGCWAIWGACPVTALADGKNQLVAISNGLAVAGIPVIAEPIAGLHLASRYEVYTEGKRCTTHQTLRQGLSSFVLHPNQYLVVYLVPTDDAGEALVGNLPLAGATSAGVRLDTGLGADLENHVAIVREGRLNGPVQVTLGIQRTSLSVTLTLATSPLAAPVTCSGP